MVENTSQIYHVELKRTCNTWYRVEKTDVFQKQVKVTEPMTP